MRFRFGRLAESASSNLQSVRYALSTMKLCNIGVPARCATHQSGSRFAGNASGSARGRSSDIRTTPVKKSMWTPPLEFADVRDLDTIDSELRFLSAVRRSIRAHGVEPSSRQIDELLDERFELTGS
jgi:hypothetical protein